MDLIEKENLKSRIEKFLYAICALDTDDLPIPLSRIEELYECLVTGDTPPTFTPLSRAEKFLMAILGVYDVNDLPEPLSRSEILLKKLATGDSNLDDNGEPLSRYEQLLAYIVQSGGIDGITPGDDFEYVVCTFSTANYTIYNTAEAPVKSAVLYGDSLVNHEGICSVKNPIMTTTGKNLFDGELENGSFVDEYEPYKSNTVTANEPIELCGTGGAKDELDLMTGEVIRRVGKVIFNGSEAWIRDGSTDLYYVYFQDLAKLLDYGDAIICDRLPVYNYHNDYSMDPSITMAITGYADLHDAWPGEQNWIYIRAVGTSDVNVVIQWLQENPITVYYQLATETTETITTTIKNQDGKDISELSTFDDITHVTLSSDELIPSATLEVATKIVDDMETINTMSLRMNDISDTQSYLQEMADSQGESVDSTMMATTEIYEEIL